MNRLRRVLILVGLLVPFVNVAAESAWRPAGTATPAPAVTLGLPKAQPAARPASNFSWNDVQILRQTPEVHTTYRTADGEIVPVNGFGGQAPGGEEQYNCGVVMDGVMPPTGPEPSGGPGFFDRLFGKSPGCGSGGCGGPPGGHPWFGGQPWQNPLANQSFRSDHEFDYFISPISNPFYFEDPRSLTEFRPLAVWERLPDSNPLTYGGNAMFFSFQGRLAINERWSIVLHRLGFAKITTNDPPTGSPASPFEGGGVSFTDIQLGPKFTFWRDPSTGSVAALGANFQIPVGNKKVFQGDGGAVTPYLSYAQRLPANFNFMASTGYHFGFSGTSADWLFVSGHLDYNIANKFFPLVEVNWYRYMNNGTGYAGSFDGADLFSTGATAIKGQNLVTVALGARYKFSEAFQVGAAYELPVTGKENFYKWRLNFDLIFRY